jgi:hypothetical protein
MNFLEEENVRLRNRISELERRLSYYEDVSDSQNLTKRQGYDRDGDYAKEEKETRLYRNELELNDQTRRKLEVKGEKERRKAEEFRGRLKLTFLFMLVVTIVIGFFLTNILPHFDEWNRPPPNINKELERLNSIESNYHLKLKT